MRGSAAEQILQVRTEMQGSFPGRENQQEKGSSVVGLSRARREKAGGSARVREEDKLGL